MLVAAGVLLFTDFESPGLATAVERIAARRGIELELGTLRLNLRKGLEASGVRATTEAAGERVEVSIDRLLLEHRLGAMLRGEIVIDRLVLERPEIEMISTDPTRDVEPEAAAGGDEARPETETSDTPESGRLSLEVGEVVLTQGRLLSSSGQGGGTTSLEGLELSLRDIGLDPAEESLLLAVSGSGWIEAEALEMDGRRLTGIAASFEIERGRYRLGEFDTETDAGRLHVSELEVDLAQNPYRYRIEMAAEGIDLDHLLGVSGLGPARVDLLGNGEGPGLAGAVAEMSLRLEGGNLPSVPLLQTTDRLLETSLDGAPYESFELFVSLAGGVLELDPADIDTGLVGLSIGGTADLDGPLNLRVHVRLPRDMFQREDVSDEVLDALTDRADELTVPLAVTGTLASPRFGPDTDYIKQVTRNLAEQARESLEQRFRTEVSGAIRRRLGR